MSQAFSVASPISSSSVPSFNPVLQAALGSLDINLEEELARYQRHCPGKPIAPPTLEDTTPSPELFGLASHDGELVQEQEKNQYPTAAEFDLVADAETDRAQTTEPSDRNAFSSTETTEEAELPSSILAGIGLSPDPKDPSPEAETNAVKGTLVDPETSEPQPQDYLESSEQLLRSVAQKEARTSQKRHSRKKALAYVGVGVFSLLLLSGAAVAYLIRYPATLSQLGVNRFFKSSQKSIARTAPPTPTIAASTPAEPPLPNGPNLTAEEFPELRVDTLSTLPISPSPSLVPQPLPTSDPVTNTPSQNLGPNQVQLPPPPVPSSPQINASPSPVQSSPTPASVNSTPEEATKPKKRNGFYYVFVNDIGAPSLAKAKKIAPDAYISEVPEGKRIQVGAYSTEAQAKALVQELEKQGLSASISNQ